MEICILWMAKSVKTHVPRISFRKGSQKVKKTTEETQMEKSETMESHEEYDQTDLPSRYRRRKPDENQIRAINSGGAE
ncbi:unnamed protein product [Nezara viridula]|uniref:Uncharacterized protein n=1 Tax=Nezara viridula TaxID=85310 RepID=A0A9P0E376_NEZVI|nr:unnamed protein product [Nezara viridula]